MQADASTNYLEPECRSLPFVRIYPWQEHRLFWEGILTRYLLAAVAPRMYSVNGTALFPHATGSPSVCCGRRSWPKIRGANRHRLYSGAQGRCLIAWEQLFWGFLSWWPVLLCRRAGELYVGIRTRVIRWTCVCLRTSCLGSSEDVSEGAFFFLVILWAACSSGKAVLPCLGLGDGEGEGLQLPSLEKVGIRMRQHLDSKGNSTGLCDMQTNVYGNKN